MVWAEEALQRARRAESRAEQELDDLDRQYEIDREALSQTLAGAREKRRERENNLASLSKQMAEGFQTSAEHDEPNLLWKTFSTIDGLVGPTIEDALAKAVQGSEQYELLHKALQAITVVHGALGVATGGSKADYYDLADDGKDGRNVDAGADKAVQVQQRQPQQQQQQQQQDGQTMDTSDARVPRWMEAKRGADGSPTDSWAPPRWRKARLDEQGPYARGGPGQGDDETQAGGTDTSAEGDDEFAPRRAQIIEQAAKDGISVPPGHLQQLCPEALEEWAAEHLLP